jgi:hypothetical protein
MTDAELFDRFVVSRRIGQRFDQNRLTQEQWEMSYGHIVRWAEHLIASARSLVPGLPPIHFDFILSPSVNACAFKDLGRYFIGVNTGTRFMLEFVFCRMLSDARIFNFIGNATGEQGSFPPLTNYTTDAEAMYRAGVHAGRPKTDERWAYATELLERAMFFIIGHELAHITRGHVDYLNSKTGNPIITEIETCDGNADVLGIDWNLPTEEYKVERQAIEADADRRSVLSAMSSAKATHETPSAVSGFRASRGSVEDLLFDWSVAMNTFFRLFGDIRVKESTTTASLYPPPPLRRFMATSIALQFVTLLWKPAEESDVTRNALQRGALYPEIAFQIMTGQENGGGGFYDAFSVDGMEYMKKIANFWSTTLGPKIAQYAYEPDASEGAEKSETIQRK